MNCRTRKLNQYATEYRHTHKNKAKTYRDIYLQDHREEIRQRHKEHYWANRTDIILTCPDCSKEFIKTGHRQVRCTECRKERQKEHHRRYVHIAKANRPPSICMDCRGEFMPIGPQHRCPSCAQIRKDKKREYQQRLQEKRTQSHEAFLEGENLRHHRWSETHREQLSRKSAAYRKAHPDKHRLHEQTRRARKLEVGGVITEIEWLDLCAHYNNQCLSCGSTTKKLTLDHVVPLSLGWSNTIDNAQPLCLSCNSRKNAKIIDYRVS